MEGPLLQYSYGFRAQLKRWGLYTRVYVILLPSANRRSAHTCRIGTREFKLQKLLCLLYVTQNTNT